jgi:hypothetical protein
MSKLKVFFLSNEHAAVLRLHLLSSSLRASVIIIVAGNTLLGSRAVLTSLIRRNRDEAH